MNRLLVLLFVVLLAGLGGFFLAIRPKPLADIAAVLPQETLALIEWADADRAWERLRRGPVGNAVPSRQLFNELMRLGMPETFVEEFRGIAVFLAAFAKNPSFSQLSAHRAVVALLPPANGSASIPFPLHRHLVFVLQQEDQEPLLKSLQEVLGRVRSRQTTVYQGELVHTLELENGPCLSYWVGQGVVICAENVLLVQRCIDHALQRLVRERVGIQLNAAYQRLRHHGHNGAEIFFYADIERLSRHLPALRQADNDNGGLLPRHLALYHRGEVGLNNNRFGFAALVDREALATFTGLHQLPAPADNPPSLRVSRETELSLWTNWFQLKKLWDFGLQASDPEVGALIASVAQQLPEAMGASFDTFFHVFGSGFGVFINKQNIPNQSDRALGCLAIEVRDQAAVLAMIKRLVAGLQVVTVKSGDTEISSVVLAGGLLQPAYAVVDQYLYLADSVELIEQARQQLKPNRDGGKEQQSWTEGRKGNLFAFVRTGDLIERLLPILSLLAKETGEQGRFLPPESRRFLREIGLPLLTGLRTVATMHLHGYVGGETILLEVDCSLPQQ